MSAIRKIRLLLLVLLLVFGSAACTKQQESKGYNSNILSSELLVTKETVYNTKVLKKEDVIRTAELESDPTYVSGKVVKTGSLEYVLKEFRISRGQQVKEGDIIAVLQGTGNESDVRKLRLEIDYFVASYEETVENMADLVDAAAAMTVNSSYDEEIRQLKVKKAQAAYDAYVLSSEYRLNTMMENLKKAEEQLELTYLYSPINGFIKSVANGFKVGDRLKANTVLCTIYDSSSVLFFASNTGGNYVYNREVSLDIGRGSKLITVKGRVVSSPEVTPKGVMGNGIYVAVNPADLKYGADHANMKVEYLMMKDALLVEKSAMETDDGLTFVMLLDGSTLKKRYIVRGPGSGLMQTVIQGLNEGDELILSSFNMGVGGKKS
jgi:multidrug efflux pump subunit AcrA (membrane-fusion protein)